MIPEVFFIGSYGENKKINSVVHDAEFSNGQIKDDSANMLAEIRLTIFDSEYFSLTLIDSIAYWNKDKTDIGVAYKHVVSPNG